MSEKDLFEKNLVYSTEFSKYVLDHPEMEAELPQGAQVFFLVDSDPVLTQKNVELAHSQKTQGQPVIFVHVKGLRPEASRLIEPHLEKVA